MGSTTPYDRLPQGDPESVRDHGWENAEKECLEAYQRELALAKEKDLYDKAVEEKNPNIYTSEYPEGNLDASDIPDDKVGRAFESALESLEDAKAFLKEFPDSEYEQRVKKFVIRQEWFTSETYKKAIENIPEEMLNAEVMIRRGIVEVGSSFEDFFLERAPIVDCNIDRKGDEVTVELIGSEIEDYTMTVHMTYSSAYGGMMYVDLIEFRYFLHYVFFLLVNLIYSLLYCLCF